MTTAPATARRTARVGLVGAGGIGGAHAEAVAGLLGAELVTVADVRPEAAHAVAERHGAAVAHVDAIGERNDLDLVIVASPPASHTTIVEGLLRRGVPVLCEKPLAVTADAARHLAELARTTSTPLTMATKFRFVDDVIETRRLIREGALGDIVKVEVSFAGTVSMVGRWNANRAVSGGGVVIDNATHAVDLIRFLVGDVSQVLMSRGPAAQAVDVEDSATLLCRTVSGALAQVDVTWSFRRFSSTYCAVYGSAGSVEIGWSGARATTIAQPDPYAFGHGYNKISALRANVDAVLTALASGQPPPVSPADAVAAATVIDAAYASALSHRWTEVLP